MHHQVEKVASHYHMMSPLLTHLTTNINLHLTQSMNQNLPDKLAKKIIIRAHGNNQMNLSLVDRLPYKKKA